MIIKVPVKQYSQPYWPEELRKGGYTGTLKIYEGFSAIIIPHPQATTKDIAKTLQLLADDFKYRAEKES